MRKLHHFLGIIAMGALILALGSCSNDNSGNGASGSNEKKLTIIIKNETTGDDAKTITGIAVCNYGDSRFLKGEGTDYSSKPTSYDTKNVASNGTETVTVTLTKNLFSDSGFGCKVWVKYGNDANDCIAWNFESKESDDESCTLTLKNGKVVIPPTLTKE